MTVSEATKLLELDQYEDLEDAVAYKLFELKQFLLSKVPFEQTYKSRFLQISKMREALQILDGDSVDQEGTDLAFDQGKPEGLLDCFSRHQEYLRSWKLLVGNSISFGQLSKLMDSRLKEYLWYAEAWLSFMKAPDVDLEVKASVEFDPMELLLALQGSTEHYDGQEILFKESKRLNLWLNINGYE